MSISAIRLIAGLGNPGASYQHTRHNAGFWFVDELARRCHASLRSDSKFHGQIARLDFNGEDVWLLKPDTFMNLSGQSIAALSRFYKIEPAQILIVHDELDLPAGTVRLKRGGGHGGHNGLRDTIEKTGSKDFARLRLGIGHPGDKSRVHNYVLGKASREEAEAIETAIARAIDVVDDIVAGQWNKAMNILHSKA